MSLVFETDVDRKVPLVPGVVYISIAHRTLALSFSWHTEETKGKR